jgi:hypothetical protein
MTAPLFDRHLAIVHSYSELIAALRARVVELGTTGETVDEVSGLPARYTAKLLALPVPVKALGPVSMGPLLGTLGLKLIVAEDAEALEKIRHRLVPRKGTNVFKPTSDQRRKRSPFAGDSEWGKLMRNRRTLLSSPKTRRRQARHAILTRWRRAKRLSSPTRPRRVPAQHASAGCRQST